MKTIAQIISVIFHPLFILSYLLFLLLMINPYLFSIQRSRDIGVLVIYVVVLTVVIPGIGVSMMKVLGLVDSLEMRVRSKRIIPLVFTGLFYMWLYINLYNNTSVPLAFTVFALGCTIALFLCFFLSIFTKISLHSTGMGGLIAAIFLIKNHFSYDYFILEIPKLGSYQIDTNLLLIVVLVLAGLVGSSRLFLKAHDKADLYGGYLVGLFAQFLAYFILMEIWKI